MLFQPIDSKREEFRKYLERAGVMDALTKVLVSLYEEAEKPDDALEYPFRVYGFAFFAGNCLVSRRRHYNIQYTFDNLIVRVHGIQILAIWT
jgi:hypothetical protein